jgi:hypothetical protein
VIWLFACSTEAEEWACVGPLVELVKWRDEVEARRIFGDVPADLATQEETRLRDAVAALRDKRGQCEMTWSILSMQEADNPGLQLRARAIEELTR